MTFAKQALSWRSKAHLDGVRLPVLVGITALIVLVLGLACASLLQAASSHGFAVTRADEEQNADEAPIDSTGEMAARVFVHVGGAVVHPGVQELEEGSRVQDAVEAAGGFADGAARDALNLARVLQDGEQVVVPTEEELTASVSPSAEVSAAPAARGRININTATAEELDALPGIGPATAEKIVADREANGPFSTIEDLKRVAGIGDKKYTELADSVCVG